MQERHSPRPLRGKVRIAVGKCSHPRKCSLFSAKRLSRPRGFHIDDAATSPIAPHSATIWGYGHPESARSRICAIEEASLAAEMFRNLVREQAPIGSREAILPRSRRRPISTRIRSGRYPDEGWRQFDPDTAMSAGTLGKPACTRVGAACRADGRRGDERQADQLLRRHAPARPSCRDADWTDGIFCFFNAQCGDRGASRASRAWRRTRGDRRFRRPSRQWDAADFLVRSAASLYASTHQMPLYPGTGSVGETGEHGTIVNAPLAPGDGGEAFRAALRERILPRIDAFAPDLVVVSAGFDAHRRDPLANLGNWSKTISPGRHR